MMITVIATRLLLSFFHFSTLFKVANLILLRKICFVSNHDKIVHNICILLTQGQGMILGGILGAAVCNKWFLKTIAGHYFQHRLKVGCNNFKYFCTFSGWMIASTIRLPLIMIFHNCVLVLLISLTITSPFSLWLTLETFSMLQNDEKSSLSWVYSLIRFFLVWFDIFEYVCVFRGFIMFYYDSQLPTMALK